MTRPSASVRQQVRQRATRRCEYCGKPEGYGGHGHHVDHIIAQKHGGSDSLNNYAWACFQCNLNKGTDIASYDSETGLLTPLYNPRTQAWNDHFQWNAAIIVAKTAVGRVTIHIPQMNDPDQVETRRLLVEAGLW